MKNLKIELNIKTGVAFDPEQLKRLEDRVKLLRSQNIERPEGPSLLDLDFWPAVFDSLKKAKYEKESG